MARRKQTPGDAGTSGPGGRQSLPRPPEHEPWTPWGKWAAERRRRKEQRQREREKQRAERQRARMLRRMRRRRLTARGAVFIGLMVLACGIGGVVLVLLGRPYPWEALGDVTGVLRLTRSLPEHRARWESLAVHHYMVEVEYIAGETWCGPAVVEVRNGHIVELPSPAETHWFPSQVCDSLLESLIFEDVFDWLQGHLDHFVPGGGSYIHITFDEDFGYPTYAEVGVYGAEVPGCCWRATWRDMRPLVDK